MYGKITELEYFTMKNNYIVARKSIDENVNQDVDFVAVKNGFISITPLSQTL